MHEQRVQAIGCVARSINDYKTVPECFKPTYFRVMFIVDWSKVIVLKELYMSFSARSAISLKYKNHNTAKFLVVISQMHAITFISKCWGGCEPDKHITSKSGFLDNIIHGDLILVDQGFGICEDLALRGAAFAIFPFIQGKSQLFRREVETSKMLSYVRRESWWAD